MIRLLAPLAIAGRLLVPLSAVAVLSLLAARPVAAGARDSHDEVQVAGVCGTGAASKLRLKSDHDGIELRFEVDHARRGVIWRVVLVQERRIAWKGTARTRPNGSFEVRRTLRDLPGTDAITARAWGPPGLVCRAAATLPES